LIVLGVLVLALLAARLAALAIDVARGYIMARLGTLVAHDLRAEVFGHVQMHSLRFFDKRKTGELMARISHDTESLESVLIDGALIVWYVGGRQVIGGEISIGTLMAFLAYLAMFYGPLQFLTRAADWMARSLASAQRVFEVLDTAPDVSEAEDAQALARIEGHVLFDDVTFGYDAYKPVLKNLKLDVRPGEMIGLVGHSGAGKSTAINLLCRFYDPDQGAILIDGIDARKIRQHDLRSQLGVVLQETFLFNGTIAENIGYARPEATPEQIMQAAKAANAHEFILKKPDGYDTVVGERGQSLSGGERQRIAIAHRLSTLRHADRLAVLKNGCIIELGTHDELLAQKGEFRRLVNMQKDMSAVVAVQG
jgi:ATP-binding cassette subfamily B protein